MTDRQAAIAAIQQTNARFGQIDVLINNAGYGLMGSIEETSEAQARARENRLRTDQQTVSEIAFGLGFDNLSYFSKLFKREVGLSPVLYKKQFLN